MATVQEGVSSTQVKNIQALINQYYMATIVAESGTFDEATTAAVKKFQADVKVRPTGIVDGNTMKLLQNPPKEKAYLLKVNGKEVYLSEADWKAFCKELCQKAAPTVDGYRNRAEEARNLWNAHKSARDGAWFLVPEMVDLWGDSKFPPEKVIAAAESAVAAMKAAMAKGDPVALRASIDKGSGDVETAIIQVKNYRDNMYAGGEALIKDLNTLKDGCVLTLEVSAAVATGGSSVWVTGAVMAGLGSYKEVLVQIDKAGTKPGSFSTVDAVGNVLVAGAVEGVVNALLHDASFGGKLTQGIASKMSGTAAKKLGKDVVGKIVEKTVKNGLDKGIETTIKKFVEAFKPGSKVTMDDAVKEIAAEAAKGAAFGVAFGKCDDQIEGIGKNYSKYFSSKDFKGLGDVDINKALSKGGEKAFESALDRAVKVVVPGAIEDGKTDKVDALIVAQMKKDAKLNSELAALVKAKKL